MPPDVTGANLGELLTAGPYRPSLLGGGVIAPVAPAPHISTGTIIARQSSQVSQVSGHYGKRCASAKRQQTLSTSVCRRDKKKTISGGADTSHSSGDGPVHRLS